MTDIPLEEIDSPGELQEILRQRKGTLVGDIHGATHCYLLRLPEDAGPAIGLAAQTHGIAPKVLLDPRSGVAFASFGSTVTAFSVKNGDIKYSKELGTPVYELLRIDPDHSAVVLHELGLMKLSPSGERLWAHDTSLVEGHEVAGDVVTLLTEDSRCSYSLVDGTILKDS